MPRTRSPKVSLRQSASNDSGNGAVAEKEMHYSTRSNNGSSSTSSNGSSPVQLADTIPPPPSNSAASNARVKRGSRHKRNRSLNRSTIPLRGGEDRAVHHKNNNDNSNDEDLVVERFTIHESDSVANMKKKTRSRSPAKNYSIRRMKMQDISAVYELGNSIFTAAEFPNMYRTWDDFAVVENFEGSPEFCFVVVVDEPDAHDHGLIIGFLLGETMTKSNVGTRGYIQWVAIKQTYRRMGIATELLHQFANTAQEENVSLLLADTPADNHPAIGLFEKVGLRYKADHVYLTKQLRDVEMDHVSENGLFNFSYTAKKKRITIRNMEIEDLHPVHAIGEQIFTIKSANLYNFWDERLVLHSYLSDPEFCVVATAKEDDEDVVVGFAFGTTIEKPRSSWRYGYLVWLGCHPNYQGCGLASQLYGVMAELFAMEKVRMVMIDTQQNNEAALRFFRKLGFGHDEEHVYLCNSPMNGRSG